MIESSPPAWTTGRWSTVTCTSSDTLAAPSVAVSRSTYTPLAENVTVVVSEWPLAKATTPCDGPLTTLQVVVRPPGGLGRPSGSLAEPASVVLAVPVAGR